MKPEDRVIVALDVKTLDAAQKLVKQLAPTIKVFKVGKELFTNVGPEVVKMIHATGAKVFLDLKYHDIPNTVENAVQAAFDLNVFMCNVHAQGGKKMMQAAASRKGKMLVIGVTILTSFDQAALEEIGIQTPIQEQVIRLAKLTQEAGLSGVVASGLEAPMIRKACGKDFVIVTPGVRPEWSAAGDQKRILTPKQAILNGADYIVVGRPITEAQDIKEAARKILSEIS